MWCLGCCNRKGGAWRGWRQQAVQLHKEEWYVRTCSLRHIGKSTGSSKADMWMQICISPVGRSSFLHPRKPFAATPFSSHPAKHIIHVLLYCWWGQLWEWRCCSILAWRWQEHRSGMAWLHWCFSASMRLSSLSVPFALIEAIPRLQPRGLKRRNCSVESRTCIVPALVRASRETC